MSTLNSCCPMEEPWNGDESCNSDVNTIGRVNSNPILDTRNYEVEFDDGDVAELTANLIAQNIYTQCDPDGNQYILLDSLVDFRRCTTALAYADQKIVGSRDDPPCADQREVGVFVANGKMDQFPGRNCQNI